MGNPTSFCSRYVNHYDVFVNYDFCSKNATLERVTREDNCQKILFEFCRTFFVSYFKHLYLFPSELFS